MLRAQSLTITLPESVIRLLNEVAQNTRLSLEQVVQQSIEGNLPPSVVNMPIDMREELIRLQTMPVNEVNTIAHSQIEPTISTRHIQLLEANEGDLLTSTQKEELSQLSLQADRHMLRKAYAWAILRWRGVTIPTLNQLPLN